ncbi:MAG: NAD-dependent epimerase/dehydratase family protein, partial [Flavobacteriaceae bacterium TMED238]
MSILITGITGQDGYYLSKMLLENDHEVHGTIRRSSTINTDRIDPLISKYEEDGQLNLHYSDLLDSASLNSLINQIKPNQIFNLAAQSHVSVSFKNPIYTTQTGTLGSVALLEAVRHANHEIRYHQASSSEMFGGI